MERIPLARTPERYYAGHLSSLARIWMWPTLRANQPRRLNCLVPLGPFTWVILTQVNTYQMNASLPEDHQLARVQIWKDRRKRGAKKHLLFGVWFVLGSFRYDFCSFFFVFCFFLLCGASSLAPSMASVCALWNQWHRRVSVTVLLYFQPVFNFEGRKKKIKWSQL